VKKLLPGHRFIVVPRTPDVNIGINQTREKFDECFFDEEGCSEGIAALENYRKEWNEDKQCFVDHPLHDWSSHYADAFRSYGQGWELPKQDNAPRLPAQRPHDAGAGY
jgi:hypothetical protein